MYKYLFVTYGEPGWRGVQLKSLRIASYFDKKEVLIWNYYDTDFIRKYGFDVEEKLATLTDPATVVFPAGIDVIVFGDVPSNEPFSYAVFIKAVQEKKKIVICEDYYRRGQYQEGVFHTFATYSDLFLFTSLSTLTEKVPPHVQFVPPRVEYTSDPKVRQQIRREFEIPEDALVLLGSGYHERVFATITQLTEQLAKEKSTFYTILLSPTPDTPVEKRGNLIIVPFDSQEGYFQLLDASDIVLGKFGFNQIMEALCLYKPVVIVGEGGYVLQKQQDILDEALRKVVFFDLNDPDGTNVMAHIRRLIEDASFRDATVAAIKALHNGTTYGGRMAADHIQALTTTSPTAKVLPTKKLAILINNELFEKEAWLQQETYVYPLCMTLAMPTEKEVVKRLPKGLLKRPLRDAVIPREGEILPHSFKQLLLFSERKMDGFVDILPWYTTWIAQLKQLLEEADTIYMTAQGEKLLQGLLTSTLQKKVTPIP